MDVSPRHLPSMIEKDQFKKAFSAALKAVKFTHKGQSWFRDGRDSIVVLNLQKSDFDEKYYVNFGAWLKALGTESFPSESKCHIQARLTSLFPDQSVMIELSCKLPSSVNEFAKFIEFITQEAAPFCEDCLRIEGLREKLACGRFRKAFMMKSARDILPIN